MRVIILGATGQDGSILSSLLSAQANLEVVAVHRSHCSKKLVFPPSMQCVGIDNYEEKSLEELFTQYLPDVIVNLVGQSSVGASFLNEAATNYANYQIPRNICNVLEKFPSAHLFHASSAYIFDCSRPIDFDSKIVAISPYAKSKASIYGYLKSLDSLSDRITILHFFNHISRNSDVRFLLPKLAHLFLSSSSENCVSVMVENTRPIRNWGLSVDYMDVVRKILDLSASQRNFEYFIGSNLSLSVIDVIETISEYCGKRFSLVDLGLQMRPHDPFRVDINPSLLTSQGLNMPSYSQEGFIGQVVDMFSESSLLKSGGV